MTTYIDRLFTLCVGIVIGIVVMFALAEHSDESENAVESLDLEREVDAVRAPISPGGQIDQNNDPIQITQVEAIPTRAGEEGEPKIRVDPISIPDVYEDHIAGRRRPPRVSFADIHKIFKNEPRDEPWAVAMESGISHYLANSGSGGWAVVEYLECRSRICEIAGYTTGGDEHDHSELIRDFLRSSLWQGRPITHSSSFGPADQKRFITIISGYSYSEYPSILSSL